MNVLLFGAGPLALAGIIVAAFVVVAPGKGSASSLGFKAGPAPSTQQISASPLATDSASPSASTSPSKKKHPLPSKTVPRTIPSKAVPRTSPSKKKASPKPTHKAGATRLNADPKGKRMGRVIARRGHQVLLPTGSAYQIKAAKPSVTLIQTSAGPESVEKWSEICTLR